MEKEAERRELEKSIYEACGRSLEGCDFLVSAFVQALNSYRRSSVCTPFPLALFPTSGDFNDKDFAAAAAAVQAFPALQHIALKSPSVDEQNCSIENDVTSTTDKSSAAIRGESSCSSKSHDGCIGGFNESPIYSSSSPSVTSQMPLGALKLLDWVLRYRHQIELVKDPATELSGLFPLSSSPWAPFRKEVSSEASVTPHYVLKVIDNKDNRSTKGQPWPEAVREGSETILAFHGTSAENLHSILRCGTFLDYCLPTPTGQPASERPTPVARNALSLSRGTPHAAEEQRLPSLAVGVGRPLGSDEVSGDVVEGLLNMSNTQLQRNGAIFGEGVYLSTDPAVAYSFCKAGDGWEQSYFGSRVRYLLVCEVARPSLQSDPSSSGAAHNPSSHLRKESNSNGVPQNYILVQNSDLVKIRFVFVYSEPTRVQRRIGSPPMAKPNRVTQRPSSRSTCAAGQMENLRLVQAFRRIDWCKAFIVLYIALLAGVGLLRSNTGKHGKGSFVHHFWPFYQ